LTILTETPGLKIELKRKAFHSLALLYALGYAVLDRTVILRVLSAILLAVTVLEIARLLFPALNRRFVSLFGGIHRPEEFNRFSGIFWTLAGTLLTMFLFRDPRVVYCAMGYLVFGDAAAALAGVRFGRIKMGKNKTVEGCSAFFWTCLAVGFFFLTPEQAAAGALFAALVEVLPLPFNDNFWLPLLSGLFLTLLR